MADNKKRKPDGEYHYIQGISEEANKKIERLIDFLDKEGLYFYNMQEEKLPKVGEVSQGSQRYVHITISIKLS